MLIHLRTNPNPHFTSTKGFGNFGNKRHKIIIPFYFDTLQHTAAKERNSLVFGYLEVV